MSVSDDLLQDDKPLQQQRGGQEKDAESNQSGAVGNPQAKSPGHQEKSKDNSKSADGGGNKADENKDDGDGGKTKKPSHFFRDHPLLIVAGIALLVIAAIAGYIWYSDSRHFESTDDAFIAGRQFTVSPKESGYITGVKVTDNQVVQQGDILVTIDQNDYKTSLAQAEAQLAQAESSLPNTDAQIAGQEAQIVQAEAQIGDARATLTLAEEENARYQQLAASGSGTVQRAQQTRSSLLQGQAGVERAIAALNAAKKQLAALQAQRLGNEANVRQARAQRDQAQINLGYTTLKADQGGRIAQLTAARGQFVQAGQALMVLVPNPLWVVANFRETQIEDMRPGQPVDIRIEAYSKRVFKGHVDSVQSGSGTAFSLLPAENATGNYVKVVQRVPVKIVFDEQPDVVIGPGMSVVPTARVR